MLKSLADLYVHGAEVHVLRDDVVVDAANLEDIVRAHAFIHAQQHTNRAVLAANSRRRREMREWAEL